MPKVSLIIPVYQVEKYILNSLKSISAQTYRDFEIIIVDNNSKDRSIGLAKDFLSNTDLNYLIIKQPIQGLPNARNKGIEVSRGEWVISIDPDDTVAPNFLEEFVSASEKTGLNIFFSKYKGVKEADLFNFEKCIDDSRILIFDTKIVLNYLLKREMPLMVSNMFIKKKVIIDNNLFFNGEMPLGADLRQLWFILPTQKKIGIIDKYIYNHLDDRPGSLMTVPTIEGIRKNIEGYKEIPEYYNQLVSQEFGEWIYSRQVLALTKTMATKCSFKDFELCRKEIYSREVYKSLKTFPDFKIRLLNRLIYWNPLLFYHLNKMLRNIISKRKR